MFAELTVHPIKNGLTVGKQKDLNSIPLRLSSLFKSCGLWTVSSELRSCVKVEVAVLGSPSLMVLMVSVDVKQH